MKVVWKQSHFGVTQIRHEAEKNCVFFYKYANENDAKILWKLNITIHIYIAYGTHGFTHMYVCMCVSIWGRCFQDTVKTRRGSLKCIYETYLLTYLLLQHLLWPVVGLSRRRDVKQGRRIHFGGSGGGRRSPLQILAGHLTLFQLQTGWLCIRYHSRFFV